VSKVRTDPFPIVEKSIAQDEVPDRPGRRDPRAVKRRPKPYQLLNRPRHLMVELEHRSKYRKNS
jgi:hypothetical protein